MNTQVAASGAGRAGVIHAGLGLKCSRYVFARFRGEVHQAKSGNGGKGGAVCVIHAQTSSWECRVGSGEPSRPLHDTPDQF